MFKSKAAAPAASLLTVDELSRAYVLQRDALVRRATRKVMDQALAEEIVQEAFLKVILASPEIANEDHLLAYLNTTVNNLCTSHARSKGIRPELVAIDADMSVDEINAIVEDTNTAMDDSLVRAEDSAIVREAISRLSAADRAVLLAETYEGLSASEIADKYGMTQESVHVAISRARKNLRGILETWVIDEETGMTAAQFLSKTYKSAKENSKKIGSAALSLVLLVAAFFGFWNNPTAPLPVAAPQVTTEAPVTTASPAPSAEKSTPTPSATPTEELQAWAINYLSKSAPLAWPGLDANGLPVGYTVNDGGSLNGLALITQDPFVMDTTNGTVSTESRFTTFQDGINVILGQKVTNKLGKISYEVNPIVRIGGLWLELVIADASTDVKQLEDGRYLITSFMIVDIDKTANSFPIAGTGLGFDLKNIPAIVATRLITTAIGAPISGQAVQVLDPLAGQP